MRAVRRQLGLSQAKLSRLSGLNQLTVNQIENARLRPYPTQLALLARALGVPEHEAQSLLEEVGDD
jgi:transcriptional regulator with XRE-family HTH domain